VSVADIFAKAELIELDKVNFKESPAVRANDDEETIVEYWNRLIDGAKFPAIDLFWIDDLNSYVIADGRKRYCAFQRNNEEQILAVVHPGGLHKALSFALEANGKHGLPLSKADVKCAVKIMLDDDEWKGWSNSKLGKKLGVSESTVQRARKAFEADIKDQPKSEDWSSDDQVLHDEGPGENGSVSAENPKKAPRKKPEQEPTRRVGLDGKSYPAAKPPVVKPVGGKEAIKPELRKEAKATFGAFVRTINKVPAWKALLEERLASIAEDMKANWSRGGK
jgi:hypothetical protein